MSFHLGISEHSKRLVIFSFLWNHRDQELELNRWLHDGAYPKQIYIVPYYSGYKSVKYGLRWFYEVIRYEEYIHWEMNTADGFANAQKKY